MLLKVHLSLPNPFSYPSAKLPAWGRNIPSDLIDSRRAQIIAYKSERSWPGSCPPAIIQIKDVSITCIMRRKNSQLQSDIWVEWSLHTYLQRHQDRKSDVDLIIIYLLSDYVVAIAMPLLVLSILQLILSYPIY